MDIKMLMAGGAVAIRIRYTKYSIYNQANAAMFCMHFLNATAPLCII